MRTIQIAEETYKYLQSKAIPFEEQPDDTIRRLLGVESAVQSKQAENQSNAIVSNHSNASVAPVGTMPEGATGVQANRQSLRDFYAKILEGKHSNDLQENKNIVLNTVNSNKSLEFPSKVGEALEKSSNSNPIDDSNSNDRSDLYSNYSIDSQPIRQTNSVIASTTVSEKDKYSNISNSNSAAKGKKKPKTNLPELVRDGLLKEGERVYFRNYRGIKFPQYAVTIADGQLRWNNSRYSMSDLASKILKDLDPSQDNEFVRGPVLWVNAAGKTIAELWDVYLAKKGV